MKDTADPRLAFQRFVLRSGRSQVDDKLTWDYVNTRSYLRRMSRGLGEFPPLIITVAITGAVQGAEVNENLPETPEAQAHSTHEAWNAGASIVHVHARRPDNLASMSHET